MSTLRILVADDHEAVRQGVRAMLDSKPEWKICGESPTGLDAINKAKLLRPDIVILDITMPDLSGLEATQEIIRALPRTEVLIFTMHDSEEMVRAALAGGARGYILKSDGGDDLISAVEALGQHKSFFTQKVAEMLLNGYVTQSTDFACINTFASHLSLRERQIIQLLAEGKTNKEIAASFSISIRTVESHRKNMMQKLHIHSVGALVRYAIKNRIVL